MTETDERILTQGAEARAAGKSVFDNPFLRPEQMPAATGDSIEDWQRKHDEWDAGWKIEDAIRS